MNIFILSKNHTRNAAYHIDKHVGKMIVEVAQQLSSAFFIISPMIANQYQQEHEIYKPAYLKHPCTIWCSQSLENFLWACEYGISLGKEFKSRYGKIHKSTIVVQKLKELSPSTDVFPKQGLTDFAQAIPDKYKDQSAISAYRQYYRNDKRKFATWKTHNPPKWFNGELTDTSFE
ncbi:hypothetical protein SS50377_24833 [Spironucleus salmonicida]|uniref:Uncharacterized protein n=1 Tax=Spironucleus salmonicida TaxID=348837 RepID=V6LT06_9EUKA|nr:hypothetical protein SS50377_24833 [Spironucleus salmonicida]|eukprot:EST46826.1 Hypothetical protein SS50377_13156 [Spironucleus salmonicida]